MVAISDCRGCKEQFPARDLGEGLCVTCFDKVPQYWEKPRQTMFVKLSDEEKKRRKRVSKRLWSTNNRERVVAGQRRLRAKVERRD